MLPTFTPRDCIKAARSAGQNSCVRIGRRSGWTVIWDDKLAAADADLDHPIPARQMLMVTDEQFDEFQAALRVGNYVGQCIRIDRSAATGRYTFTARTDGGHEGLVVTLHFDEHEYEAFVDGVQKHEFDLDQFSATV